MRLFLLPLGSLSVDKGRTITAGVDEGVFIEVPVWAALLDTPLGWVLVDTGMHPIHVDDPDATFRSTDYATLIRPRMSEQDMITSRLAELGIAPSAIRYVVNTHLHFDHCGGNGLFPDATFLVQRTEYEVAFASPGEYHVRDYAAPGVRYELIDGHYTLHPSIELLPTPGHTLGHQSVLVRLGRRSVILPGDAISLHELLEGVAGAWRDSAAGAASVQRLRQLAESEGAEILVSHDMRLWRGWPHAPKEFV